MANQIKLLTGNSHPVLARQVADRCVNRMIHETKSRRILTGDITLVQARNRNRKDAEPELLQPGDCRDCGGVCERRRWLELFDYAVDDCGRLMIFRLLAVFILMSTAPGDINDALMELLIMTHACRAASARRITAVVPNFRM
jgi:ribose-phosphate pyrophosphokinase